MTSHTVLEAKAEQGINWSPNCPCFKWEQLKPAFRAEEPNTSNSYVLFVLSRPESQNPRILEPKELAWGIVSANNAYAVYEKLIKFHYNVERVYFGVREGQRPGPLSENFRFIKPTQSDAYLLNQNKRIFLGLN